MRKNEVKIVNADGQESVVIRSAFDRVWSSRGWTIAEPVAPGEAVADSPQEAELVAGAVAGDPPDSQASAPVVASPASNPARRSAPEATQADGGTGTPESTQTPS
jgi:hypothetical protein